MVGFGLKGTGPGLRGLKETEVSDWAWVFSSGFGSKNGGFGQREVGTSKFRIGPEA